MPITLMLPFNDESYASRIVVALNSVAPKSVIGQDPSTLQLDTDDKGLACIRNCLAAIEQDEGMRFILQVH